MPIDEMELLRASPPRKRIHDGMQIDLNCDIGESFALSGIEGNGTAIGRNGIDLTSSEEALLEVVTSVNIACGFHAGDHNSMAAITRAAVSKKISVGAHPSLPDRGSALADAMMRYPHRDLQSRSLPDRRAFGLRACRGHRPRACETAWRALSHGGEGS